MIRQLLAAAILLAGCSRAKESTSAPVRSADAAPAAAGPRAVQLALGEAHTCVLLADGGVRCWGLGADGRLGLGNTDTIGDDEPAGRAPPVDLGGPAVAIAAGIWHTCALMATKRVRCWGRGEDGQLGYGNPENVGDDETPASVGDVPLSEDVSAIAIRGNATCALLAGGAIRCWGENREGSLGYATRKQPPRLGDDEPVESMPPITFDRRVVELGASNAEFCVLFDDRKVRCWGAVMGSADADHAAALRSDIDVGADVAHLSGSGLMCVITTTGGARCWGGGMSLLESIGVARNVEEELLVLVDVGDLPLPGKVEQIALSGAHGCALLVGGDVRCWGDRRLGILGVPPGAYVPAKDAVEVDLGEPATSIGVGAFHSCAITNVGGVRCWGMAKDGRLGYGTLENVGEKRTPAAVGDVPLR
jgi:alpha-tubulin suppressor-like RCC1 family protein